MLKILIFENDLELLNKLKSLFTSITLFHEIKIANDEVNCLKLLKNEYFDVFVMKIESDKFLELVIKALPDIVSLPVLCTNTDIDLNKLTKHSKIEVSKQSFNLIYLLSGLSEILPKDLLKANDQLIEGFVPVKMSVLRNLKNTPCDVFIKLSQEKHIKIFNADDDIQFSILDRYENKKIHELYIKKTDFYRFSDELFSHTMPKAELYETRVDYYSQSQKVIKDIILEIGINENVIKLVDDLVDSAVVEYKDASLTNLLNKFKHSPERYIYDHSMLTSVFAVAMCEKFEWRNRQILQKIVFSSIFHDFAFKDTKLAFFEGNAKDNENLTKEQRNEILTHPERISELLASNKSISSEVLSLVSKHHEAHGDQGYPNAVGSGSLSIPECVFIVAHEFTNELYKIAFRDDKIAKAVENVCAFSNTGNLKQVREAFLTTVAEKFQLNK
jgi:HD-GYP domain-containing protein (c-di-GMP phosphodiesterase class II)